MSEKELIKRIKKLPSEAQQEAADFVEYLSQKYIEQPVDSSTSKKNQFLKVRSGECGRAVKTCKTVQSGFGNFGKAVGLNKNNYGSTCNC
jgi:hypothetical protein